MKKLLMLIGALIMCNAYGDTESVIWLNDDGAQYASNTCDTIDGTITLPPEPTSTKSGSWRFIGWREMPLEEVVLINGTSRTPTSGNGSKTWTVTFPYGTITGEIRCSSTSGINNEAGAPSTMAGQNCWCRMTNAGPLASLISSYYWWFIHDYSIGSTNCSTYCAFYCSGALVMLNADFRKLLFGVQ